MGRSDNIKDDVEYLLEALFDAYRASEDTKGDVRLDGKHELAELTVENWWRLQGRLLSWAQAHMTGYAILRNCPKLVDYLEQKLGYEVCEDCHVLELIGFQYVLNCEETEELELVDKILTEFEAEHSEDLLSSQAMRIFLNELFMSRCAKTSYWRFPLQDGLRALNEGQVLPIMKAVNNKRQGQPYSLLICKLDALSQVWFRIGKGMKKYRALEIVAEGIGQSTETLKSWEKKLKDSPDCSLHLFSCKLAGEFLDELESGSYFDIPDYELFGMSRGVYNLEKAEFLLPRLKNMKFGDLRKDISRYRQGKTVRYEHD